MKSYAKDERPRDLKIEVIYADEIDNATNLPTGHACYKSQIVVNGEDILRDDSDRILKNESYDGNRLCHAMVTSQHLSYLILNLLMGKDSYQEKP